MNPSRIYKLILIILGFSYGPVIHANTDAKTSLNPQQQLAIWQQNYNVSAISLSVDNTKGQILTWTIGTQQLGMKGPITADTLFRMNSVTKSFTAALSLKLIEQGKLSLDMPITQYLPQYQTWKQITVRELLNQTSGIFDYINVPGWFKQLAMQPNKVWTPAKLVDIAYQHPLDFVPGKSWAYSNTNYVLLGMIIEKVTGKSMRDNLQQTFFTPLHLKHTYYVAAQISEYIKSTLAHGYFRGQDVTFENPSVWQAAAGVISTTHDMALWFHNLMDGNILSPQSQALMTTWVSTQNGQPVQFQPLGAMAYGIGVFYNVNPTIIFVPGISSGYRALVAYIPATNTTFALALNNGLPDSPHFVFDMLKQLYNK